MRRYLAFFGAVALVASSAHGAEEASCAPQLLDQMKKVRVALHGRELKAAEAQLELARRRLAEEVPCAHGELRLDLLEGQLLIYRAELAAADELLHQLSVPEDAPRSIAAQYHFLAGTLAYELGQVRRARDHYAERLALDRAAGKPKHVAADLYNIAITYVDEAADAEGRQAVIERLRETFQEIEEASPSTLAKLHVLLGKVLGGPEGRRHLEQGLEMSDAPETVVSALGAQAVERLAADPAAALRLVDRAWNLAETAWKEEGNVWPHLGLAPDRLIVRWAALPRDRAIADAFATLSHIEDLRLRQSDRAVRAGFFSVWAVAYQWLTGALLEDAAAIADPDAAAARLAQAFEVLERYRGRVLADSLEAALGTGPPVAARQVFAELEEVRAELAEDEAYLAFQVAPWENVYGRFGGGGWVVAVHRGGARAYRLPERGALERRVRFYLRLLGRPDDDFGPAAARLYQDLLADALADLPAQVDKLILSPDGDLHLLPFASLRPAVDLPPLAMSHQISTVPSASLWRRWRASPRAAREAALVLANPLPGGAQAEPLRQALGPLPDADREGRAVVRQVGGGSLLWRGSEASERALKKLDLSAFGLLHFAAHAVVHDVHPERSSVLLAPGDGDDGELRAPEIAVLELEGQVVVLAACQSAWGTVVRGEGMMSLARAFFQAGASTVVGSLWPLDDRQARHLFDGFYRRLGRGSTVREALQGAQLELRAAGAPAAAWAGVVVLGDGARAPLSGRGWRSWIAAVVALLGGLAAVAAVGIVADRWHGGRRRGGRG